MAQPDPAHPLTEFYLRYARLWIRQAALRCLPCIISTWAPCAPDLRKKRGAGVSPSCAAGREALSACQAAVQIWVLYGNLPVAADGAPAALLLTGECTRSVTAQRGNCRRRGGSLFCFAGVHGILKPIRRCGGVKKVLLHVCE